MAGVVVAMPSTSISESARSSLRRAASRSWPQTMIFATRLS